MSLSLVFLAALAVMASCGSAAPPVTEPTMHDVQILDSHIVHRQAGSGTGPAVVFLHGNPTSSHVWRDVIPHVAKRARCLAPDLTGMGGSGKPAIAYRFADHARYLDAWFDALDLRDVIIVGYDWGGSLGMDWAARHPDRVRGLVVFETFLRPMEWKEWSPKGAELFRTLRAPGPGEKMVLETNEFLNRSLENGVARRLGEDEQAEYYAPYPEPASRRPMLQWPREIPIDGEPADVREIFERYDRWLAAKPGVPKLLLTFEKPAALHPSPTGAAPMIEWARANIAELEVAALGEAGHHAPEDLPHDIGRAIADWIARKQLAAGARR